MTLLKIEDLAVRQGGRRILRDVSLSVDAGEIVTIVGPNGSGKTTLLRAAIGALRASSGVVTRRSGLRIGYVPQKLKLDRTLPMQVGRFLALPSKSARVGAAEALQAAGAGDLVNRSMTALSGGQFQRVLLARALADRPELLILDEPTTGLDQSGAATFYRQIETVRDEFGCGILMVSHDLHVVMSASDRVICLNGHICCQGTPAAVAAAPEYQAMFGSGTEGALALYRHEHDHNHHHPEHN